MPSLDSPPPSSPTYVSASSSLGKAGSLEVRLAQTPEEIKAAQILRYEVFYEECGARPNELISRLKQDVSPIDDFCDVLLVVDHACNKVVGTYRFMLREAALLHGEYFTASEFDITKVLSFPGQIMELGRSCVHKDYRNRATIQLLWRGIAAYMNSNNVGLFFGCGSFVGTDVSQYAQALSYLHYHHLAPSDIRAKALPQHFQKMDLLPAHDVNTKEAMKQLPPLIKGYLRLGGCVGEGAFIDTQFNSIDVCIIVQRDVITDRYSQRYDTSLHPSGAKEE